jgi:glycosyltransferase involved in cell wall biosynthesis
MNTNGGSSPLLSIILPTYNEEGAIGETILAIHDLKLPSYELLVIDDGSTDATARVASAAGATVISHPYNIGNGAAVKTGIRCSRGDVVLFMDGDGQHDPRDIPRMVAHIDRYHMVIGARSRDSQTHWHRTIANKVFNTFASIVSDFPIQDLTSGFRAMRRRDAVRFCDMFPNRFSYPTTSTLAFLRSGRAIRYIPIKTRFRIGTSKIRALRDGVEFLLIITKIAMSFAPFRIFLPVASFLFFAGLFRYLYTYVVMRQFTNMSHLLINSSIIVFMLGLIAEQIASLRLERGDRLFEPEDAARYAAVAAMAKHVSEMQRPDEYGRAH